MLKSPQIDAFDAAAFNHKFECRQGAAAVVVRKIQGISWIAMSGLLGSNIAVCY